MKPLLGRVEPYAFALFRIVIGLLFLQHGAQKLLGWPSALGFQLAPLLRVAGTIELTCGFLIMIGLVSDFAAFLACGEMAAAYFIGHFPHGFWPIVNKGEPAVLFCFAFLFIAAHGAGIWSVDSLWRKSSRYRVTEVTARKVA
ncbi:MAG TPA: DoxX family protein [Terriglobales bacterium]|nr:DoxX family protein [Terriglobales bacterium]